MSTTPPPSPPPPPPPPPPIQNRRPAALALKKLLCGSWMIRYFTATARTWGMLEKQTHTQLFPQPIKMITNKKYQLYIILTKQLKIADISCN